MQATAESARQLSIAHAHAGAVDLMSGKPAGAAGHFERQLHEARTVRVGGWWRRSFRGDRKIERRGAWRRLVGKSGRKSGGVVEGGRGRGKEKREREEGERDGERER